MTLKLENEKELIRCEYCNSTDNVFMGYRGYDAGFSISKKDTFGIYRCNGCSLFFNFPRPTAEELREFFRQEYHSVRYGKTLQSLLKNYPTRTPWSVLIMQTKRIVKKILSKIRRSKSADIGRIIRRYLDTDTKKRPTVYEIGTGTAPLLYLQYIGYDYTGVEPAEEVVDVFNRKGYKNIKQGYGENLYFIDSSSADAVVFIGTLSHTFNLKEIFKECHRILKDGGIILIVDSNADNDVPRHIGGSYTNYGFSRTFLEKSVYGFKLLHYFYIDDYKRYDENGSKILAVLKKSKDVAMTRRN